MLSIDQEEPKGQDESRPNAGSQAQTKQGDASKLTALQQKVLEGIEKTKVFCF